MRWTIRYVHVLWFIFHVQQLSLIGFTQLNPCYNSKPTMKHLQNQILNRTESEQFILFILNSGDKTFFNIRVPFCLVR
jgi:hypothetical protein